MSLIIFDFGGTTVKYAVWNEGEIYELSQVPTPRSLDLFYELIISVKNDAIKKYEINGASFSFPGAVDAKNGEIRGITPLPYTQHFPLRDKLSELLDMPVAIANDANCAALAEMWQGVAKDVQNALFIVIGTGIGGVVISNGQIHAGRNLFGGEFGVTLVGGQTPWSEVATAVFMARRYCRRLGLAENAFSGEEVFELAKQGDSVAMGVVDDFYQNLSIGLFNLQTSFDPDMIIIGGGLSANDEIINNIKTYLQNLFNKFNFSEINFEIKACKFRNNANLVGAVKNFFDEQGGQ